MDYHGAKSLLNRYISKHVGGENRPVFFDIDATYPPLTNVTRHAATIQAEFDRLMERNPRLPRYHEVDSGEAKISNTTAYDWNVFMLDILGQKPRANREMCPETCHVLDGVPNMFQAFFSILDPGKSVPMHEGPYLGYLRYHLALRVPQDHPPKIIVNGQPYTWQEGRAVLFDDSWPHEVVNQSHQMRAILIVDVLRPMSRMPAMVNRFVTKVVGRNTYARKVARNAARFANANQSARKAA